MRTEHYYYDGVRRIQEVIGEPQAPVTPGGEPEPITLGEEPGLEGGIGSPEPLPELPPQERSYWRHREFIWGPEYVDELILQQEVRPEGSGGPAHGPAVYAITNLGFDVVALADAAGSVLRQYVYDPYGHVIEAGSLADHAPNRVGHKGLFFHRLDGPAQGPQLVGGAMGLYHCRNRELRPDLQRWMQQDPNGTGQVVLGWGPMHGGALFPDAALPSAGAMFTDGVHLAGYVGSSPVLRADGLGLFFGGYTGAAATMAVGMYDTVENAYWTARQGADAWLGLREMMTGYLAFQEVDMEWAGDWSLSDEASSHSMSFVLGIGPWSDAPSSAEDDDDPETTASIRLGKNQSRALYNQRRSQWNSVRRAFWKQEAKRVGTKAALRGWSEADIKRMKKGLAPEGWVMHHQRPLAHGGSNSLRNIVVMPSSMHQKGFGRLHRPPYRLPGQATRPPGATPGGPRIIVPGGTKRR